MSNNQNQKKTVTRKHDVNWVDSLENDIKKYFNGMDQPGQVQLLALPVPERNMKLTEEYREEIAEWNKAVEDKINAENFVLLCNAVEEYATALNIAASELSTTQETIIIAAVTGNYKADIKLLKEVGRTVFQKAQFFESHGKMDYGSKKAALQSDRELEKVWKIDRDVITKMFDGGKLTLDEYHIRMSDHFLTYPIVGKPSIPVRQITKVYGDIQIDVTAKFTDRRIMRAPKVVKKKSKNVIVLKKHTV